MYEQELNQSLTQLTRFLARAHSTKIGKNPEFLPAEEGKICIRYTLGTHRSDESMVEDQVKALKKQAANIGIHIEYVPPVAFSVRDTVTFTADDTMDTVQAIHKLMRDKAYAQAVGSFTSVITDAIKEQESMVGHFLKRGGFAPQEVEALKKKALGEALASVTAKDKPQSR